MCTCAIYTIQQDAKLDISLFQKLLLQKFSLVDSSILDSIEMLHVPHCGQVVLHNSAMEFLSGMLATIAWI